MHRYPQYQAGVGVDPRSARQFNIIKQGKRFFSKI
jgi:deoxyribodipyrimidine photolyase